MPAALMTDCRMLSSRKYQTMPN